MSKRQSTTSKNIELKNIPDVDKQLKIIIAPKNEEQRTMMKTISENTITFVCGPPGSGKTLLAITFALQQLFRGKYKQIVATRPVVEAAGERLGFLPGDMQEKIDPYMMPIYNFLYKLVEEEALKKMLSKNGKPAVIQICPLAYMRGSTFSDSLVLCDEAQNMTSDQMRMFLTRIGENSKMIICGDLDQSDIKIDGLKEAFDIFKDIPSIGFVELTEESIIRHPIIKAIEERYRNRSKK